MKEFISNHLWIIPVVAAFLTIGVGILIGWFLTKDINLYDGYSSLPKSDDETKDCWHDNPLNPANPNSQLNLNNPASIIWNNRVDSN